jgi:alpha-tubulin suppressor-like RCC1 family protein
MPIKLLIHQNVPGKDILQNSIKDEVDWEITNSLSGVPNDITRLGLMYDNHHTGIPFGTESLTIDGYKFFYFKKELFDLVQQNHITVVDLLACDMNSPLFIDEVQRIKHVLPDLTINYSLNKTGGAVGSDWVMESNGQSVKDLYFNQNIVNYNYSLGSANVHSAIVMADGTVHTFGSNVAGELGNGTLTNSPLPVQVLGITNAIMASCGEIFTAVLLADGTIRTFGYNRFGQLGNGTQTNSPIPVGVCLIVNGTAVACGAFHTAVLLAGGEVMTFGRNDFGQFGNGNEIDSNLPIQVNGIVNARAVGCGYGHTAVVLTNSTVRTFGNNSGGQLGNGTTTDSNLPVTVCGISNAIAVAGGFLHTAVLTNDGKVMTFGANNNGQLGIGTLIDYNIPVQVPGITNATAIACAYLHTVILLNDGTVRAFGNNQFGQLGIGSITFGSCTPVTVNGINNAIAVACGALHTGILLDDGTVRTFGSNFVGQLGDGSNTDRSAPVSVTLGLDKVFRIWDSLIGSIYCVHQDNLVRTKRGYVPIKEVVAGDTVYDERNREVAVKYNIKLMTPNKEYIKIEKNAFRPNVPLNDLFIVKGHPVKYMKREIDCEKLVGLNPKVKEVTLDSGSYVYCLCTENRVFVNIENVPICTRTEESWAEIVKNKRDIQWVGQ